MSFSYTCCRSALKEHVLTGFTPGSVAARTAQSVIGITRPFAYWEAIESCACVELPTQERLVAEVRHGQQGAISWKGNGNRGHG